MITNSTFVLLALLGLLAVALPVTLLIVWRRKTKAPLIPALFGALTFLLFALTLEQIPVFLLFQLESPVSAYINSHSWCYALVGALLAGLFEETGRFCALSLLKKSHSTKQTAITFGIGHGGFECAALIGMSAVQMIVFAAMIRMGTWDDMLAELPKEALPSMETLRQSIESVSPGWVLMSLWERICAMIFHIAMSVLVFFSVHRKQQRYLYPLAILLHMLLDIFAALYQKGVYGIGVTELCITAFTLITAVPIFIWYKKQPA